MLIPLLLSGFALASPIPCRFWTHEPAASAPGYDIAQAYAAATLVAVVKAVPGTGKRDASGSFDGQKAHVVTLVKGSAPGEIELAGVHGGGTDFNGISLPEKGEFLVLLGGGPKYDYADAGSACPNSFEVKDGKARIGKNEVAVGGLKKFFESKPKPID